LYPVVIRYSLPDKEYQEADVFARDLVAEEFHWLVISSFEREMVRIIYKFFK
jgi:hypothetical protein